MRAKAPPRIGRGGKEHHLDWSLSHVYKMMHLGTYRGVVINEDLWQRAQRRKHKDSKPGPGGRVYPFAGIRCSCGDRLHSRTNTGSTYHVNQQGERVEYPRKKMSVWYVCQSLKHTSGPKFRSFREDRIEEKWLAILKKLALAKGTLPTRRPVNLAPRIEMMTRRLDVLLRRRGKIHTAFEEGVYDARTMQQRLAAVEKEERALEADIAATKNEHEQQLQLVIGRDRAALLIKNAARHYVSANRQERAAFNAALFEVLGTPIVRDNYELSF